MIRCKACPHQGHFPGHCPECRCGQPAANSMTLAEARESLARSAKKRAAKKKGDAWEEEVISKAKVCGWLVHHVRPAKTAKGWRSPISGHKGFPDLALVHPKRFIFILAECKSGEFARISPDQHRWHEPLIGSGARVEVWKPENRAAIWQILEGVRTA